MLATKKSVNSVNISSKEDDKYWCGEFFSRYAQHQLNLLGSLTVCIFLSLVTEMSITRHSQSEDTLWKVTLWKVTVYLS